MSPDEEDELLRRCKGSKSTRDNREEVDHVMLAAGMILTIDIGLRKEELLEGDWTRVDSTRRSGRSPAACPAWRAP